ncbi:FAD/NAD(P)-binding protein [Epilithonimonas sp. JDS]|uniref:FAD/NAD(P)-binding protein n=1 Tax=Epilithonimonas sp. JDS TaxID=2902797 RepID=UPI001E48ACFD|nr:FAD/NAD(P)-binding protein [Epilithonimonas sp. JDS]MCD9855552.1 FAD/NAD(P)-binding protein [Epilithonimonas sp. JDS]
MQHIYSQSIALIGGGPAALMILKHIVENKQYPNTITIFEKNDRLGVGMPYGKNGSNKEHVANISASELPDFEINFEDYITKHPPHEFPDFYSNGVFNVNQVIPRLVLGNYLEFLFHWYIKTVQKEGCTVVIKTNCTVDDIAFNNDNQYTISTNSEDLFYVDIVILCTGHSWPKKYEEQVKGWFDSPYPPSKFTAELNGHVAIRGTSLTAVDAVKTLARLNGTYVSHEDGKLTYELHEGSENFKITLFSTGGFLPALRFHSDGEAYSSSWLMSMKDIYDYKSCHGGFVDLDYVFDLNFKQPLKEKDPDFYEKIKNLNIEDFAEHMLELRKEVDSFDLFKAEYREAEKSIDRQQPISWKEMLADFSYAMNYPAKHFSAEDMLRLRKSMMPLISVIIASLPQSSYREIISLYEAGLIDLIQVDKDSKVVPHEESGAVYHYTSENQQILEKHYSIFIDAIGQQPINYEDFPFEGIKKDNLLSQAYLSFKDNENAAALLSEGNRQVYKGYNDNYYLRIPGLEINDYFQAMNSYGEIISGLYIMAVPLIGGLNPDYSGLDFCDTAAERIVSSLFADQLEKPDAEEQDEIAS